MTASDTTFQSSPGPGAGCCMQDVLCIVNADTMFQSSPGPGAGCCDDLPLIARKRPIVSILTRPGGRVLRRRTRQCLGALRVSILTRPGGRVLPGRGRRKWRKHDSVSILTRPGGRVLPAVLG